MKRSFKKIPLKLQNAVIAITGEFPGVGKSYWKEQLARELKSQGYQVLLTGSTNKACMLQSGQHVDTVYSYNVANWTDYQESKKQKKFVRKTKDFKIHNQKQAFIFIDEAFMLAQSDIDLLKKQFPKCCFILVGDPNQFPPIEDISLLKSFDEMPKDVYNKQLGAIRNAIKTGIKRDEIYDIDCCFNLTKQYRIKTPELNSVLKNIKSGFKSQVKMLEFFSEHSAGNYDFAICRTWEGVYSHSNYRIENNRRVLIEKKIPGVWVGQNNIGAIRNALYDNNGNSVEGLPSVILDGKNYKWQPAVTCHAIQGATLNEGVKVLIDVDDAMSIFDGSEVMARDFSRFLYIALSRVQNENDLVIKCKNIELFCQIMSYSVELNNFNFNFISSKTREGMFVKTLEEILPEKIKIEKKPAENKFSHYYSIILSYSINKLYNTLTWNNLRIIDKCKILHISPNTYIRDKIIIESAVEKYFNNYDYNPRVFVTKSIGELEMEEQQAKQEESKLQQKLYKCLDAIEKQYFDKSQNIEMLKLLAYQNYKRWAVFNHKTVVEKEIFEKIMEK